MDRPTTSSDQIHGQAGWDVGINFLDLDDLASKLRTLVLPEWVPGGGRQVRSGQIERLAIHAHGVSGEVYISGARNAASALTAQSVTTHRQVLNNIGLLTPDNRSNHAVILFMGCLAGSGSAGTALLLALSRVWPNREVVAFATLGYAPGGEMSRSGEGCTEPGMRDTTALYAGEADRDASRHWRDTNVWPWASEVSPRAKVALNEKIIRGGNW